MQTTNKKTTVCAFMLFIFAITTVLLIIFGNWYVAYLAAVAVFRHVYDDFKYKSHKETEKCN